MNRTRSTVLVTAVLVTAGMGWHVAAASAAEETAEPDVHVYLYPLLDPEEPASWGNSGVQVKVGAVPSCAEVPSGAQIDYVVPGTPAPEVIVPPAQGFPRGTVLSAEHVTVPVCVPEPEPTPTPEPTPEPTVPPQEPQAPVSPPVTPGPVPTAPEPAPGSLEASVREYAQAHRIPAEAVVVELG